MRRRRFVGLAVLPVALGVWVAPAHPAAAACTSCIVIQRGSGSSVSLNVAKDGPYTCADSRTPKGVLNGTERTDVKYGWADAGCYFLYSGQRAYVYNVSTGVQTGPIVSDNWHRLAEEGYPVLKRVTILD